MNTVNQIQISSQSNFRLSLHERIFLLVLGDVVLLFVSFFISIWLWSLIASTDFFGHLSEHFYLLLLLVPWLLVSIISNSYSIRNITKLFRVLRQPLRVTVIVWFIYVCVYFLAPKGSLPRIVVLFFGVISCALLIIWRICHFRIFSHHNLRERVIVVGEPQLSDKIVTLLEKNSLYFNIVDVITTENFKNHFFSHKKIDRIVFACQDSPFLRCPDQLLKARQMGIIVSSIPGTYEHLLGRIPIEYLNDWYLSSFLQNTESFTLYPFMSRILDISLALIGLFFFLFILPLLALVIKLSSPGPLFFSQMRVGKNGHVFRLWKLRTMVHNAEKQGPIWTEQHDQRITKVGKWLRKSHLDELPQLWNVLKGDLSIVGIRPLSVEQCKKFSETIPFHDLRHTIKPGVTGWAAINHKHVNDIEGAQVRLEYDLYYIKHQSIWLDFLIIFRTVWTIITLNTL